MSADSSGRMIRPAASINARCENACGKVAEVPAGLGVELLRVEAERRCHSEQLLHQVACLLQLPHDGERGDQPERADQERPLLAREPVVGLVRLVAEHEAVLGQLLGDRLHGRPQPLVVPGQEPEDRREEHRGVERVGVVVLPENAAAVDALGEDVLLDLVRDRGPFLLQVAVAADLGELGGAVEGDPAHQLRRDVLLRLPARLPDALVGLLPHADRAFRLRLDEWPEAPRQALAAARVQQDRVERGAEDVVLPLVEGAVPDPDRPRAGVPGELVARRFLQVAAAVDPVHDLERFVLGRLDVRDEGHELVGLPGQVQHVQRLEREGRVADPGVAVVPVALAAGGLRQRGRERGDGRAGRHVGEPLDRERGALDRVAEAMVGDPGAAEPGSPEADGRVDPLDGLVRRLRCVQIRIPRERAERPLARAEDVPRPDPVLLDPEREVGVQAEALVRAGRLGAVPIVVQQRPGGRLAPVVERRLADELDLDVALEAFDRANEHVIGVVVGGRTRVRRDRVLVAARPHRQRVAHDDPAVGRLPRRLEHVRPRLVDDRSRVVDPERRHAEEAGLAVEQAAEDARRVEARDAQPVDRPVGRDQRAGVAVRQERVLRDRRERRGRGRALDAGLGCRLGGGHDATHGPCQRP